jgi:opacity protein-like surface antigen
MKKIVLFVLLMCVITSFAFASEVSFYYTSQAHQRYWHYTDNGIRFDWYKGNVGIDLNVTPLLRQNPLVLNEAWMKFGGKTFGAKVGMVWYPFGNFENLPSKEISIFQPTALGLKESAVMLDFCGMFGDLAWQAYWADAGRIAWNQPYDKPSFMGIHLAYDMADLKIGASVRGKNLISNDKDYPDVGKIVEYGVDICWLLAKSVKINLQGYNVQEALTTDDTQMDMFGIVSYEKGLELPFVKLTRPYAGYFSKDGMDDYNIVVGLNMKPMENVFMKLEYNRNSAGSGSNILTLQAGYVF